MAEFLDILDGSLGRPNAPPPVPVITGTPGFLGTMLTCTVANSYQWKRDGVSISGATSRTYMQGGFDVGPALTCVTEGGPSNALAYTPLDEGSGLIEWLDPRTLTPGLVASWVGRKGVMTLTAAGGARPTASATSMNGKPGVTGNGTANVMSGSLDLSAYSALRCIAAMVDTTSSDSTPMEFTTNVSTQDGSFRIETNFGSGTIHLWARGSSAAGVAAFDETLATPQCVSFCPDTSLTVGGRFVRVNGTALASTGSIASCGPGNFANSTLYLFGRNASGFWGGTYGHVVFIPGNATDATCDRLERFIVYQTSLTQWTDVLICGDSTAEGRNGLTGGFRPGVNAALGADHHFVGPFSSHGFHRGVPNERLSQIVADLPTFGATLLLYHPQKIWLGWVINDCRNGRTAAQIFADYTTLIAYIRSLLPAAVIAIGSAIVSTDGVGATAFADYNAGVAAFAAAQAARLSALGAPTLDSDKIHPVDTAGGYPSEVAAIAAALA